VIKTFVGIDVLFKRLLHVDPVMPDDLFDKQVFPGLVFAVRQFAHHSGQGVMR
jgi:hypothetical protein